MSPIELTKAQRAKLAPLEHAEQSLLFQWAELAKGQHPELDDLYAIPNFSGRLGKTPPIAAVIQAAKLNREGRKKGVPDIHLPHARWSYHSLYIEMKRLHGDGPTKEQLDWHRRLTRAGHCVRVCYGWEAAREIIEWYLSISPLPDHL